MEKAGFDLLRAKPFGGSLSQSQVEGINALCKAFLLYDGDKPKLAYVLATAFHETAKTMRPITEYGSASSAEGWLDENGG